MEIRILGPLEVMAEGNPVDLPAGKARLLLAALVVQANQVISTDRLVEFLWHGQPPDSAANTQQTSSPIHDAALNRPARRASRVGSWSPASPATRR